MGSGLHHRGLQGLFDFTELGMPVDEATNTAGLFRATTKPGTFQVTASVALAY